MTYTQNHALEINFGPNAITSNLSQFIAEGDVSPADAVESVLLALACEGVEPDKLKRAVHTMMDAVASNADDLPGDDEPSDEAYRAAAAERCSESEVDADAAVSRGEDCGAYVQCWFFVSEWDAEIEQERLESCEGLGKGAA